MIAGNSLRHKLSQKKKLQRDGGKHASKVAPFYIVITSRFDFFLPGVSCCDDVINTQANRER